MKLENERQPMGDGRVRLAASSSATATGFSASFWKACVNPLHNIGGPPQSFDLLRRRNEPPHQVVLIKGNARALHA